jgi:hypothetical protein
MQLPLTDMMRRRGFDVFDPRSPEQDKAAAAKARDAQRAEAMIVAGAFDGAAGERALQKLAEVILLRLEYRPEHDVAMMAETLAIRAAHANGQKAVLAYIRQCVTIARGDQPAPEGP